MRKTLAQLLNNTKPEKQSKTRMGVYDGSSFDFFHLIKEWPNIVGEMLSENTLPMKIQNKSLIVIIKHSSFTTHLKFLEQEIIGKVKDKFPSLSPLIKKIQFINSSNFFDEKQKFQKIQKTKFHEGDEHQFHKYSPELVALEQEFSEKFPDIKDQDLKKHIFSLFLQKK